MSNEIRDAAIKMLSNQIDRLAQLENSLHWSRTLYDETQDPAFLRHIQEAEFLLQEEFGQ